MKKKILSLLLAMLLLLGLVPPAALADGSLHVFDISTFTVGGAVLESYEADVDTDPAYTPDTEAVADGYFHESEHRSAPYFDVEIDGITLLDTAF